VYIVLYVHMFVCVMYVYVYMELHVCFDLQSCILLCICEFKTVSKHSVGIRYYIGAYHVCCLCRWYKNMYTLVENFSLCTELLSSQSFKGESDLVKPSLHEI